MRPAFREVLGGGEEGGPDRLGLFSHERVHTNNKNLRLPGPISKQLLARLEEAISAVQEEEEREKKEKKVGPKGKAKAGPRPASATASR